MAMHQQRAANSKNFAYLSHVEKLGTLKSKTKGKNSLCSESNFLKHTVDIRKMVNPKQKIVTITIIINYQYK